MELHNKSIVENWCLKREQNLDSGASSLMNLWFRGVLYRAIDADIETLYIRSNKEDFIYGSALFAICRVRRDGDRRTWTCFRTMASKHCIAVVIELPCKVGRAAQC
jgi:hypothetical protein